MNPVSYKRHRFAPDVMSHAVWLHFRFVLSLCFVEELLAERGIEISYETAILDAHVLPAYAANVRRWR